MACFYPVRAWRTEAGEVVFAERGKILAALVLPCGQCIGCRLERSRQWAMRCVHESQLFDVNSFVTLTYDPEHVPGSGSLDYRDFQLFMKRLRKTGRKARFFMCGEYGSTTWRPHFHACLFNVGFGDRRLYRRMPSGFDLYSSVELDALWGKGFCSVGDVTFESAAYVARYVVKKVFGSDGRDFGFPVGDCSYRVDDVTGEVTFYKPEFTHMSLKPGIGAEWFRKFRASSEFDFIWVNGQKVKPPKYYDRLLGEVNPAVKEVHDFERYLKSFVMEEDSQEPRLRVREVVARARLGFKKRGLE